MRNDLVEKKKITQNFKKNWKNIKWKDIDQKYTNELHSKQQMEYKIIHLNKLKEKITFIEQTIIAIVHDVDEQVESSNQLPIINVEQNEKIKVENIKKWLNALKIRVKLLQTN